MPSIPPGPPDHHLTHMAVDSPTPKSNSWLYVATPVASPPPAPSQAVTVMMKAYTLLSMTLTVASTLSSVPNSNSTVTTDSPNAWADTSILSNHTNTTPTYHPLVSTFTHSDSNLKNTNLREHAICLVSITLPSNLHSPLTPLPATVT